MTIEERAVKYAESLNLVGYAFTCATAAYIAGAKEQKDIDHEDWEKDMRFVNVQKNERIQREIEWLEFLFEDVPERKWVEEKITEFRNVMEE